MQGANEENQTPVFYDKSGRRWIGLQAALVLIVGLLLVFAPLLIPAILVPSSPVAYQPPEERVLPDKKHVYKGSPVELANELSKTNTPVIGKGPLARVVKVDSNENAVRALDPFSGMPVGVLSAEEAKYMGDDTYALQRYGNTSGKRIALTFDDGPNGRYTPELLDLLSHKSARASFFVTGENVVKYPELTRRIASEGHTIGNHTFSHINFVTTQPMLATQEINQTNRLITGATQYRTSFFRPPYGGETDQSLRNSLVGILTAQQLGYVNTFYDFDSNDWRFTAGAKPKLPPLDGDDKVILLHDGGGDRHATVEYVGKLIDQARERGYTFVNLAQLYPQQTPLAGATSASVADNAAFAAAWSLLVLPREMITWLFFFSLTSIILITFLNIVLAVIQHIRSRRRKVSAASEVLPAVTVIVPAYNEGEVIEKSVESILSSSYQNLDVVIVDDGSTDATYQIARKVAKSRANVSAFHQENGGKAKALNNGLTHARGDIVVCVDADTLFAPKTIWHLVQHFKDEKVGAVAGVVKVGNVKSMLTRWQAMEYALSIAIERNAHALLGAIMIVPGACGAWRKSAILEAGGFSSHTLAEDCDMTLAIQSLGRYKIEQENNAISYTEAPMKARSLAKQRFRWTFGSMQALYKHRHMIFDEHFSWLGLLVMPYAVISILIPLFFWPLLALVTFQNILAGNLAVILGFFAVTLCLQFVIALIGLGLARAPLRYIIAVPFARFVYGPIRIYILYKSLATILRGSHVGWNKLARTGTVTAEKELVQARSTS